MARDKKNSAGMIDEDSPAVESVVQGKMTLERYYDDIQPGVDKYIRAYLTTQFRGELHTPDEWSLKLSKI